MSICKKYIVRFVVVFAILLLAACASRPGVRVEGLPHYDALFENEEGWTGADGAYTVALAENRILWLFGDTWFGEIRNGKHVNASIINNTVAIQRGSIPSGATVRFYTGKTSKGAPQAFIKPADGRGWFWIYHGAIAPDGLYMFLLQVDRTDAPMSSGFKILGSWLGHIKNFRDHPSLWKIDQCKVPWASFTAAANTFYGSWVLKKNGFFYIYGIDEEVADHIPRKFMILARAPEAGLAHFDQWRFYSDGHWTADFTAADHLCANMANEYSVSFVPKIAKYAAIYSENGISKNIVARYAADPWGPWSDTVILFQCPEMRRGSDILCYAAKGHPDLSPEPAELVVTYVANSTDFYKMAANAELYRPRFLRVWFE